MKHEVIFLADFLGNERRLYLKQECDSETLSECIDRFRDAVFQNIQKLGTPNFQKLRFGIACLKKYFFEYIFFSRRPEQWTIQEFESLIARCSFFECQILQKEIEEILDEMKKNNKKYDSKLWNHIEIVFGLRN